jgi:hypothetical protein
MRLEVFHNNLKQEFYVTSILKNMCSYATKNTEDLQDED